MKGALRAWQIQTDTSGEYLEVRETETREGVSVAILRGGNMTQVWLSPMAWQTLTDLRYCGPEVRWAKEAAE